ncbi:MAG: phage holin family protein [Candidatus Paceibacterota bacterium]
MKTILHFLVYAFAVMVTAYILPGVHVSGLVAVLVVAVVLGLINAIVRPLLLLVTLPLSIMTLGLFVFVLNALLVLLTARIVPGFSVDSFWWALLFGIVLTLVNWILKRFE